ncbi:MAG: zinc-ribbon domain-containing protein [Candidatus Aenigmatarchaeota archaeon]|nr:MAG: zinc-ribbon domain-containing protein [Candidatus Aenigmarchaeota archaeon]
MNTSFVIKSIWVFVLGAAVTVVGLYCLLYRPDMGTSNTFVIMLMGLFFTGAGSIYGKRKLSEGEPVVSGPPQQKPFGVPPQTAQETPKSYPGYPPKETPPKPAGIQAEQKEAPTEEFLEIAEEAMEPGGEVREPVPEPAVEKPGIPAKPMAKPGETGIIKIVVCPNCGEENEIKDKFCYNCGFKLKPEKKKKPRKRKAVKPAFKIPVKKPAKPVVKTLPRAAMVTPAKKKPVKRV